MHHHIAVGPIIPVIQCNIVSCYVCHAVQNKFKQSNLTIPLFIRTAFYSVLFCSVLYSKSNQVKSNLRNSNKIVLMIGLSNGVPDRINSSKFIFLPSKCLYDS